LIQDTAQKAAEDVTLTQFISDHTSPMSSHIFGLHLPHFDLPASLAFLNNVTDASGAYVSFQVTANMVAMLLSAVVVLVFVALSRKKDGSLTKIGHSVESILLFVRDDIAIPNMGDRLGRALTPFLTTLFFFILVMNYFSLLPNSSTATANISVTACLAVIVFVLVEILSIKEIGFKHYIGHLTGGTPWALWPIMVPIEIVGKFSKPFALAIRLFANMTAGHIIIFALLGLIGSFGTLWISPISVGMALFVYVLECLVALLQAFIFTLLTALFIGLATAGGHEEEHNTAH
jgi:F-type H+-transporting ATPase subunit a